MAVFCFVAFSAFIFIGFILPCLVSDWKEITRNRRIRRHKSNDKFLLD